MKRERGLYERMISDENILLAIKTVSKLHPNCKKIKRINKNIPKVVSIVRKELLNLYSNPSEYKTKVIHENNKTRELLVIKFFPDRIIHHCIAQIIIPILTKKLIPFTYQSIKGRGIHLGIRHVKKVIKNNPNLHFVKIDVKKFYPSVDKEILKTIVARYFKEKKILTILNNLIDSSPQGLPIGNHTSQIFSNIYLNDLDQAMTRNKKGKLHYFRYADDIVLLSDNRFLLKEKLEYIQNFLKNERNLSYHIPVKGKVDDNGLNFLGVRLFSNYTLIRSRTARKIKRIKRFAKKGYITEGDFCRIASYWGYSHFSNCFNLFRNAFLDSKRIYIISLIAKFSRELNINFNYKHINFHKYNRSFITP